jgi:hypothetical protein
MNADQRLGFNTQYETVAVSQTDQVIGSAGAQGDLLERVIVTVATAATGTCSIKDAAGGSEIPLTAANTPIGVYVVELGIRAQTATSGGWRITTGAGATAVAVGRFS